MVNVTDPHTTDFANCSRPDCTVIAQRNGLCSTHYMSYYYETRNGLRDEVAKATRDHGQPSEFFCELLADCNNPASRWWVMCGSTPTAICADHAQEQVDTYRMEIRRLELK